jgi:transposase
MRKSPKYSPEVMERAVRMVFDAKDQYASQWAAIESISAKIGCTAETLRKWVRQGERDSGVRPGATTAEQQRIKELEREVLELRKTNEILKLASAYFAQAAASTATTGSERLHRRAPRSPGGRADLHRAAGRPVGVPAPCCPSARAGAAVGACPA